MIFTPCVKPIEAPTAPGTCINCEVPVEWRELPSAWGRELFHVQADSDVAKVQEQVNQIVWRADRLYAQASGLDAEANRLLRSIGKKELRRVG